MIPSWMREACADPPQAGFVRAGKKSFVKKTLDGILNFFEDTVTSEEFTRQKGLLQDLDPRAKLISVIALVVALSMAADLRLLAMAYLLMLLFAYASHIGIWFFIKRVWLFIPIFAGIIALPMVFNIFMQGDTLITLMPGLTITRQGVVGASIFTLRVAACVSAAVLLLLTTPRNALFKSLRSLGIPKVYVMTLDMCYRYIFLFIEMVKGFYTAKKSRSIKSLPLGEEQKWVGGRIGYTLVKSLDMGEKVHQAMVSRGFNGDARIMDDFRLRAKDYAAITASLVLSVILILLSQNIIRV